jgi:adenylate cyclase class IV
MIDRVAAAVKTLHDDPDIVVGNAADLYWSAPKGSVGDFVRLRRNSNASSHGQLTLKATDRGDTLDRVEIDLEVDDYKQARELMLALHGKPLAEVSKKYHVFFLENPDTTISVYQVKDDDRVFVEIEARNKRRLKQLVQAISTNTNTEYEWVQSSVFNMFVEKKQMVTKPINTFLDGV